MAVLEKWKLSELSEQTWEPDNEHRFPRSLSRGDPEKVRKLDGKLGYDHHTPQMGCSSY